MRVTVNFMVTRITPSLLFHLSERQSGLATSTGRVSTYLTVDAYTIIVVSPLIGLEVDCHLETQSRDKTAPLQEKVGQK